MTPIKPVLSIRELAALIGVSVRRLHQLRRQHSHPAVQQLDAPGHPKFSGLAVERWIAGLPTVDEPKRRRPLLSSHRQVRPQQLVMAKAALRTR